jgi:hypothetical protein
VIKNIKNQKGLSLIEAITASAILALSAIVFMTLQSQQEERFTLLRKFDKAAYAVDLMFEELTAVYNPVPIQYGIPLVNANTSPNNQITIKGLTSLPDAGDRFIIAGVAGTYEITARTNLTPSATSVLTIERSDVPSDTINKNLAGNANLNAAITFTSNANGSLEKFHNLNLLNYSDVTYQNTLLSDVRPKLIKWGELLNQHLGRPFLNDKRLIEVTNVNVNIPVDENNDGITDQIAGVDQFTIASKTQVTIRLKQDRVEEIFRRHYTNGS